MATITTATNLNEASQLFIPDANKIHQILNGDADTTVSVENGYIPTIRKVYADNLYFYSEVLAWTSGNNAVSSQQLYNFGGLLYWAPSATSSNVVPLGTTPIGDDSWQVAPTRWNYLQAVAIVYNTTVDNVALLQTGDIDTTNGVNYFYDADNEVVYRYVGDAITGTISTVGDATDGIVIITMSDDTTYNIKDDANVTELKAVAIANNTTLDNVEFLYKGVLLTGQEFLRVVSEEKTYFVAGGVAGTVSDSGTDANGVRTISTTANGDFTVEISDAKNKMPLSYFGSDESALISLLMYAKTTGKPIYLTSDVIITSGITVDFEDVKLNLDFNGYSILSDIAALTLQNLRYKSEIIDPSFKNVTAPWAITYWDENGDWLTATEALATLTQTNDDGYFMPTSNMSTVWAGLTTEQQNQTISAKLTIVDSDGVVLRRPKGRYCLYEFQSCNYCEVYEPDIQQGGKGSQGTIVFNNNLDTVNYSYGIGNYVHGGTVRYGSFSGVNFLRNKRGGVDGEFKPFRVGESGVKTSQNNVNGYSSRCYEMIFNNIHPYQTLFDGTDFNSDYGASAERTQDYTLAEYGWHQLPTKHVVTNIISDDCNGVGVWGDGADNVYKNVVAKNCPYYGISLNVYDSLLQNLTTVECNTSNTASRHQITVPYTGNYIKNAMVITSSSITTGYAIYAPNSYVIDSNAVGGRTAILAISYGAKKFASLELGSDLTSEDSVTIDLHPRGVNLTNGAAALVGTIDSAVSGSETGNAALNGRYQGSLVNGVKAFGALGGFGRLAFPSTTPELYLENATLAFYEDGTNVHMKAKLADGTVITKQITSE